ncbi:hypothetical protein C3L33_08012, partial [Rhododendron williamsianum]
MYVASWSCREMQKSVAPESSSATVADMEMRLDRETGTENIRLIVVVLRYSNVLRKVMDVGKLKR